MFTSIKEWFAKRAAAQKAKRRAEGAWYAATVAAHANSPAHAVELLECDLDTACMFNDPGSAFEDGIRDILRVLRSAQ